MGFACLAQRLAVAQGTKGLVGDKFGVGVQVLLAGELLLVPRLNSVNGQPLHGRNHVEQEEVQLPHLFGAVLEGFARLGGVEVLVLVVPKSLLVGS